MVKAGIYFVVSLLLIVLVAKNIYAQPIKREAATDSPKTDFVSKMQAFAKRSAEESAREFDADKAVIAQNRIFAEIKATMQNAKFYLKSGLDTTGAKLQLDHINKDYAIAGDGVFTGKGTAQTFRNLTATSKILTELLSKANIRKAHLNEYQIRLTSFRYDLDSLLSQPPLFKFPTDSAELSRYLQKIVVVAKEVTPVDSALKLANNNVQSLYNQFSLEVVKLQGGLEEIELYQRRMAGNTLTREFGNIWEPSGYHRPLGEILKQARDKGFLTLVFYLQDNSSKVFLLVVLIVACFIYLRSLKSIYIEKQLLDENYAGQLVLKYPLFSALLIIINVFQFIFISPPFILNVICWTIVSVSLTLLFQGYITKYWMKVWLLLFGLFLIASLDNLILQATRPERWFMLIIALLGVVSGLVIFIKGPKAELRVKWIVISIVFMSALEFLSVIANVLGRYNFAKTLMISGFLNVVIGILFLWTVRLINEGLFLAFNVYTRQDKKLFYLNFQKVGDKVPVVFYVLLVLGWAVLFGRNFAGFEYLASPLQEFFSRRRTLGDYDFSINSLLLFFVIMGAAVIISKIVSFFASDERVHTNAGKDIKPGIGSWVLLIRIVILTIGLFLGIAAAGIPMDRITIVLGALGVGIGFGLQTLVNNLVSGLIIAFEKPVNLGDVVEIDGHGGTMKSIGFRSSVITTWEGADMIMPNGDLLNSHLTNWSLGGNRKRVSILIGIAYDADLQKVKQLLTGILEIDDHIATTPATVIQYEQFSNNSIDIRIYFWTKHMRDSYTTRSDLIMAITSAFKENGIEFPIPQQDIHLYKKTDDGAEDTNKGTHN